MRSRFFADYPTAWTICPMRFLLAFAQGGLLSPLLPLFHETFQVGYGELGLLTSMAGVSCVIMDIAATSFLSHLPLLSMLFSGIALTVLGLLGCLLAPDFYWLVGAQVLLGFGNGMTRLAGLTAVVTATPRHALGRASNLLEFSAIAGLAISPSLSGLLASVWHWKAAFAVALVFVGAALSWVIGTRQALLDGMHRRESKEVLSTRSAADVLSQAERPRRVPRLRGITIAYIATFMMSFVWAGFISTAMPLFGGEEVGIPTATLGLVFTAGLLMDLVLLLPLGWLSDRLEYRLVLTPALFLMAGALAWLPGAANLGGLLLVSVCLHTSFAAWGMPSAALAVLTQGERLTRTMGFYRLLIDGAVVIAPWLVGVLIEHFGYAFPSLLTASLVAGTALLVLWGMR